MLGEREDLRLHGRVVQERDDGLGVKQGLQARASCFCAQRVNTKSGKPASQPARGADPKLSKTRPVCVCVALVSWAKT